MMWRVQEMGRGGGAPLQQSEVLDDATARSLFVDLDPVKGHGAGRVFRMSFDARDYDPGEVAVRCEDGCLVVEAQHHEQDGSAGSKVTREFQRRIQLPQDVDPAKLTSTLSADGILTVEAPVPPRYQAVVGGPAATVSVQARASPVTVRREPVSKLVSDGRSRSPFIDGVVSSTTGRSSPLIAANSGFVPIPMNGGGSGLRNSPITFNTLAPAAFVAPNAVPGVPAAGQNIDSPRITTDPATGQRRLELLLELGRPYTAEDIVVRVDGRRLTIDARHEARDQQGHVSTSTTQKQFDLSDHLDAETVQATLRDDGKMLITGSIKQ